MKYLFLFFYLLILQGIKAQTDSITAVKDSAISKSNVFVSVDSKKDTINKKDTSIYKEIESIYLFTTTLNGDSMRVYALPEFRKYANKSEEEKRKYARLIRNVKKVMPYAKLSAFRLQLLEDNLNLLSTKREKKKYTKAVEKEIKEEFTKELKKLSVDQGRILLKLLHRETGKTSYEILKNFRGSASTFMWGVMAKIYHGDIKSTYDPLGEDREIEGIIKVYKLD